MLGYWLVKGMVKAYRVCTTRDFAELLVVCMYVGYVTIMVSACVLVFPYVEYMAVRVFIGGWVIGDLLVALIGMLLVIASRGR